MELFRKKSLDTLKSPEQIRDHIQLLTWPVVTLALACLCMLIGLVLWAAVTQLSDGTSLINYVLGA